MLKKIAGKVSKGERKRSRKAKEERKMIEGYVWERVRSNHVEVNE